MDHEDLEFSDHGRVLPHGGAAIAVVIFSVGFWMGVGLGIAVARWFW